jgi:hypothetical protein
MQRIGTDKKNKRREESCELWVVSCEKNRREREEELRTQNSEDRRQKISRKSAKR